jgi:hypothetical protein
MGAVSVQCIIAQRKESAEEAPVHPFLKYLSLLPQFHASHVYESVLEMRTGVVVTKVHSDEPKHADTLNLRFPGQEPDIECHVNGWEYVRLQSLEARRLGVAEEDTEAGIATLEWELKA